MEEEFNILEYVKVQMGFEGLDYHDKKLNQFIDEVKLTLIDAGVKPEVASSKLAAGVIAQGVNDIWNYGSGSAKLSEFFNLRASQLSLIDVEGGE